MSMSTDKNTENNNSTLTATITDIERLKEALDVFRRTSPGVYGDLLALAEDAEDEGEDIEACADAFSDLAVSADATAALCGALLDKLQADLQAEKLQADTQGANIETIPEGTEVSEHACPGALM